MLEFASSNWVIRALVLLLIFGVVAAVVLFVSSATSRRIQVVRELAALGGEGGAAQETLTRQRSEGAWARMVKRIEAAGFSLSDTAESEISKQLKAAGYISQSAPRVYTLVRLILIFALPGLWLVAAWLRPEPPTLWQLYVGSAVLMIMGAYLPNLFIRAKADRRRQEIVNGFPDSLDLMLVCVEAGLGLESSLDRVGRELATTHPRISEMLTETTLLMRAGASREDALRKLGDTAGVDEIKSFATLLIQSDKLGTSLATTLRVYSSEMREARRLRAEEKAHRLPVLLSIPLVVFMLPTMIGVIILPAIVMSIREVLPAMTGGS
ncbi:type II secretion system F family protein [Altererythrobacter sp.]|uniref:type II secretion system F family protein n=1 Tax=Altererythrobacter sp. TaxID=1872480 RepID=UPI001AFE392E|nr:type II secretion system F family protein [Altererythrobacter sp.]MBO6608736.1 type II secretion system F family protein [Altererythrobacter sp.]MBO6642991.1 type II secretion system F family protein [Altererythrobacter sp.]MBO6709734.1 type II secretion system F family protein [Altererythrobacter sp.]